ncbi:hypothetical protein AURDEDRAFT_119095 [Auricularia subglabra TFB-10046 SS5]|nr:hypothetical protein AURDEDRAFT_119095 [Auricularia subglabra TFB-10046 SS5]
MLFAFSFCLFFASLAVAASTSFEDNDIGRIAFTPPITQNSCKSSQPYRDACAGRWWNEGVKVGNDGVHSMLWTYGGTATAPSLSFKFSGSNITIRGLRHAAGAKAVVVVDGVSHPINTMSVDGKRHPQRLLYNQTLLDPRVNHTLELRFNPATYNGTAPSAATPLRFLAIDSFRVDTPESEKNGLVTMLTTARHHLMRTDPARWYSSLRLSVLWLEP